MLRFFSFSLYLLIKIQIPVKGDSAAYKETTEILKNRLAFER
jgi:hypothetical protein